MVACKLSGVSPLAWISPASGTLILPSVRTGTFPVTSGSFHTLIASRSPGPIMYAESVLTRSGGAVAAATRVFDRTVASLTGCEFLSCPWTRAALVVRTAAARIVSLCFHANEISQLMFLLCSHHWCARALGSGAEPPSHDLALHLMLFFLDDLV